MSGRVEFSYSHTEELPAGGRLAAELHKALRARDEQEADVYFTLKTRDARGKERELSRLYLASISLHLPYISPISPLHLPISRPHLPCISPTSPLYLAGARAARVPLQYLARLDGRRPVA